MLPLAEHLVAGARRGSAGRAASLPAGLVFRQKGDGHATLSGVPAEGSKGAHLISISVSNSLGELTVHYVLKVVSK